MECQTALPPENRPVIRLWQVSSVDDLTLEGECLLMQEAIFRLVLNARHSATVDCCYPLSAGEKPSGTGAYKASPMAFLKQGGQLQFSAGRFPMPAAKDQQITWDELKDTGFGDQIKECEKNAASLATNYTNQLLQIGLVANFLALDHLLPEVIEKLKNIFIGSDPALEGNEKAWLKRLSKAELHGHLGGIAGTTEVIELAAAYQLILALKMMKYKLGVSTKKGEICGKLKKARKFRQHYPMRRH